MTALHSIAADHPELAILGATIKQALDDAQAGDWLTSDGCQDWLDWLIPESAELETVHAALLGMAKPRKPWQRRLKL